MFKIETFPEFKIYKWKVGQQLFVSSIQVPVYFSLFFESKSNENKTKSYNISC